MQTSSDVPRWYTHIYVYLYIYIYICIHKYMIYMLYVYVYVHKMYKCVCIYTYTYTHTNEHLQRYKHQEQYAQSHIQRYMPYCFDLPCRRDAQGTCSWLLIGNYLVIVAVHNRNWPFSVLDLPQLDGFVCNLSCQPCLHINHASNFCSIFHFLDSKKEYKNGRKQRIQNWN